MEHTKKTETKTLGFGYRIVLKLVGGVHEAKPKANVPKALVRMLKHLSTEELAEVSGALEYLGGLDKKDLRKIRHELNTL